MASGATSTWGRPYPLSTDAPTVHTDIEALANSLEGVPLYPTTATSSRTGLAGESVVVSPSQTLTTSATPTRGDILQVIAHPSTTGTTQVTVAIGGSKVVNGLGLSSATSFVLGANGARARIQFDGTSWRLIDGMQDTGLVAPTLTGSFVSDAGKPVFYRVQGDRVFFQGNADNNTGTSVPSNTTVFTMPIGMRPARVVAPPYIGNGSSSVTPQFNTNGTVVTQANLSSSAGSVTFDGLWYSLI